MTNDYYGYIFYKDGKYFALPGLESDYTDICSDHYHTDYKKCLVKIVHIGYLEDRNHFERLMTPEFKKLKLEQDFKINEK